MVGATTPAQNAATLKVYDVRVPRLHQQLEWYRENTHLYKNVGERADWEETVASMGTRVVMDRSEDQQTMVSRGVHHVERSLNQDIQTEAGVLNETVNIGANDDEMDSRLNDNAGTNELISGNSDITGADGSVLHSGAGRGVEELALATWRHNAPVPAHQNVAPDDEVCDQTPDGLVSMRAFWGSNEERSGARADLFSMQLELGQPTIFFTLSPDSSSSYRIANLAGEIPDSVLSQMESGISEALVYSRAKLGRIAASNPYICARYFDRIVNICIDMVLNWDTDNNCARKEPGLFGSTKAFYAATESQNSTGSLHTHMLIWVDGMPSTVDDYYRMCSLDRFRAAMVKYVDAIASSNVPLDISSCPSCGIGTTSPL
ncbi:unnamed protein product [Phytophthora fragariaefolia]|uniref:Unnamed protein product n=1 Tax=Phytophthora fragariaefolia TaxID=1490495 RepID=A0A9W6U6I7_9STRA|nr:unnamed protein product [Phytophthora fragariaefolia]